ncbi:MAG TPA: nucleotide sugar dehydrogenase [Steroidobacteraceae bacterium]|nr:nucleotide sugar dehydrogenase [Steroidobacteraceae bacterium]
MSLQLDALRVNKQYTRDAWLDESSSGDVAPVAAQRSISIFGLGYVGAVSLACLARDGHEVYGVDIDPTKLELVRSGRSPIIEEGMQELMRAVVNGGGVTVTDSMRDAILSTDVSFVCVGTPPKPNGNQDLTALLRLAEEIGKVLPEKSTRHLIVIRSTVKPGTIDELIKPKIEAISGLKAGVDFSICFQPEFLREGTSINDYDNPPFTIVGADDDYAMEELRTIFGHLPCEMVRTSVRTAEMLKYACNAFHAVKVTFANEIGRICQSTDVDPHEVMKLVCMDRQLNISPAYLRPGFAFGGSCLPKDLKALLYLAKTNDVELPMLANVMPSNRTHIDHAIAQVMESGKRKIGIIGLSFKAGTDDLRESPLVAMVEHFIGKGLDVCIYDPSVNIARLVGANRRFIEESIPHIASLMTTDVEALVERSEVLVVAMKSPEVLSAVSKATVDQSVLDLAQLPDRRAGNAAYRGVCW